jgi:molybdopterin converting factor small subunit
LTYLGTIKLIRVKAKLFATLRDYLPPDVPGSEMVVELEECAKIEEVISRFNIPDDMELIIMVNSAHAKKTKVLEDGDVLSLFPPIAGG